MPIIMDRSIIHHNFTVRKALYFGVTAGVGAAVTLGLTYVLTEWAGWWYMASVITASVVALVAKFVITAVWVFK